MAGIVKALKSIPPPTKCCSTESTAYHRRRWVSLHPSSASIRRAAKLQRPDPPSKFNPPLPIQRRQNTYIRATSTAEKKWCCSNPPPFFPFRPSISQGGLRMTESDLAEVYLGLRVTQVFRVARLFATISFFVQGPSLAFDRSRCVCDSFATIERRRVREERGSKESPPPPPPLPPTRIIVCFATYAHGHRSHGEVCNQLLHLYSCALWSAQYLYSFLENPPPVSRPQTAGAFVSHRNRFPSPFWGVGGGRQILVLRSQFVRRCLQTLVVIFIMAGLTHFLVEMQRADWGTGEGEMPFHDALYYIVVSFSTVG